MHPKRTASRLLFVFIAVALTLAVPSMTEAKSLWHLRAFGVWIEPDLDYKVPADDDIDLLATADGGLGLGISAEYQFSDRLGLELGVLRASSDIVLDYRLREFDASFSVSDSLAMTAITLGLDVHLLPESRLDLYLSPFLGYVRNSDLEFTIDQSFDIDGQIITIQDTARIQIASDVAYGATLGVDIPFSSRPWAVATSLRYLATELDASDPDGESISPDFNSWILTVGLRYSF